MNFNLNFSLQNHFCICLEKKRNWLYVQTRRLIFNLPFKYTKPFLYGSKKFWRTKFVDKYQGAFVCVYDQNYAIVLVTQQKNRTWQYIYAKILSVHLSFKYAKPFMSGYKQFWRAKLSDKCYGAFVCAYDQNYTFPIVTQPKRYESVISLDRKTQFPFIVQLYKTIYVWV